MSNHEADRRKHARKLQEAGKWRELREFLSVDSENPLPPIPQADIGGTARSAGGTNRTGGAEPSPEAPRASVDVDRVREAIKAVPRLREHKVPGMSILIENVMENEVVALLDLWERAEQGNWEAAARERDYLRTVGEGGATRLARVTSSVVPGDEPIVVSANQGAEAGPPPKTETLVGVGPEGYTFTEEPRASVDVAWGRELVEKHQGAFHPPESALGWIVRNVPALLDVYEKAEQGNWMEIAEKAAAAKKWSENEGDCDYISAIFDAIPDVPSESPDEDVIYRCRNKGHWEWTHMPAANAKCPAKLGEYCDWEKGTFKPAEEKA